LADFYNPYMKGPDWSKGINQWMAQKRAMMEAALGGTPEQIPQGTQMDPMQQRGVPQPAQQMMSNGPMSMAIPEGAVPGMSSGYAPTGGSGGTSGGIGGGKLSPEELQIVMKVLQAVGGMGGRGGR
jgi:hypothetical protein